MIDRDGGGTSLDALADLPHTTEVIHRPDGTELALFRLPAGGAGGDRSRVSGCTVVLAHCWTGDRRTWGQVARQLASHGLDVLLYDHRGHGSSTVGSAGCTIEALGDDLTAVVEHLGPGQVVLGGHSLGGMSVQSMAARHTELFLHRVAGVVLVATTYRRPRGTRGPVGPKVVAHPRLDRLMHRPQAETRTGRGFVGREKRPEYMRAMAETFRSTPGPVRGDFLTAMRAMDLSPGLRAMSGVPVTVVVGSHDRFTPPSHSREIAAALRGSRLVQVPGAGHMLPFEATELVTGLVVDRARHLPSAMTQKGSSS